MDLTSGYPYSLIKNGLPFNYPKLTKDINSDFVILGGGISGALIAHYLTAEGKECILIDGRTIGLGSSCASTSLLQYEIDVPLVTLQEKIGEAGAVRAYKWCEEAIFRLEDIASEIGFGDFEKKASLYYAESAADLGLLEKEYECRKKAGFGVEWLTRPEIERQYAFSAPGGILSTSAAQTNAYTFTHSLLQYNLKKGLQVYDRTLAVKISHEKDGVTIQTGDGRTIKARKLVYANGYESVNYIDKKIVELHSTYALCSEQMAPGEMILDAHTLLWSTGNPYLYMRTTADNRVMLGGRDEPFYDPEKRDKLLEKKTRALQQDYKKLFGKDLKMEFSWTGTFGSTQDGLPYIGPYEKLNHSFFALGFGGNGITFSLIAAEILSNTLKGKKDASGLFTFNR